MAGNIGAQPGTSEDRKSRIAIWVAVVSLVVFALLIGALFFFFVTTTDEKIWTRYTFLLSSVEAIAFAGAGYLWGKEVHREQAEDANKRAKDAGQVAEEAKKQAGNAEERAVRAEEHGKDFIKYIENKVASQQTRGPAYGKLGGSQASELTQADFDEILKVAKGIFQ